MLAVALGLLLVVALAAALEAALAALSPRASEPASSRAFRFTTAASASASAAAPEFVEHERRFYTTAPFHRMSAAHAGPYARAGWPFRGRAPEPAPPDVQRVACLGDSCVFGTGLLPAQTLSEQLALALEALDAPRERVQVLNLGVPGYSSAQLEWLLDEALERWRLHAIVLYPAAWNDGAYALQAGDLELAAARDAARWPDLLERSHTLRALRALAQHADPIQPDVARLEAAWLEGHPLRGTRMTADETRACVERMLELCARRGVHAIVVAAAHPDSTRARHARTGIDASAVLDVARARGAPALDAHALLRATGRDEHELFFDAVHPSPFAVHELVLALAPLVRAALRDPRGGEGATTSSAETSTAATTPASADPHAAPSARPSETPRANARTPLRVEPRVLPCLGDVRVRVELVEEQRVHSDTGATAARRARDAATLPWIQIGGAPLLELRELDVGVFEGIAGADAAGAADVLVQTERGVWIARAAVERVAPVLAFEPASADRATPAAFRVTGRAGDEFEIIGSPRELERPWFQLAGAIRIDLALAFPVVLRGALGDDGSARIALADERGPYVLRGFAQARVRPRGASDSAGILTEACPFDTRD